jgi:hypothetical protein
VEKYFIQKVAARLVCPRYFPVRNARNRSERRNQKAA